MEAGDSVSPCFSVAGTSRHDLHEVITSVAMIRSHQGLRSYGLRRHRRGGAIERNARPFSHFTFFTYIFVFSIIDLDLLWSAKS